MSATSSTTKHHQVMDEDLDYDPNNLLDACADLLCAKNDAALARTLNVAPPIISKIRHKRLAIGASMLIRMHELTALSIKELRLLMGDRRERFIAYNGYFVQRRVPPARGRR